MTDNRKSIYKSIKRSFIGDRGSTLVTVIVIIAFLTIMATTLLYLSSMNYVMKRTDKEVKQSFYDTETAMEEIRAGLTEIAAEAAKEAYYKNMIQYSVDDPFTRYANYQKAYYDALKDVWNAKLAADPDFVSHMTESKFDGCVTLSSYAYSDGTAVPAGQLDFKNVDDGYIFLRNVSVSYTSTTPGGQAYTANIETDFLFTAPDMNWAVSESYTTIDPDATDTVDTRREYDISEFVNYVNWKKK